jgi:RHS repeat-associated protein
MFIYSISCFLVMKRGFFIIIFVLVISPTLAEEVEITKIFQTKENILIEEVGKEVYFYAGSKLIAVNEEYKYQDRLGSDIESKSLPFGQPLEIENRFSFSGKEFDSNLYYFNARYYDSNLGKFTSTDPVRNNHAYSYVRNNPMNLIDPDGRIEVRIHGMNDQDLSSLSGFFGAVPDSLYPNAVSNNGIDIYLTREDLGENIGGVYDANSISVNPSYLYNLIDEGKEIPSHIYGSAMIMLFLDAFHETIHWNIEGGVVQTLNPPQAENFPEGVSPYDYGYMVRNYLDQGMQNEASTYLSDFRNFYFGVIDNKIMEERQVRGAEVEAINWLTTFDSGVGPAGRDKLIERTTNNGDFEENYYLGFKEELSMKFDSWQNVIDTSGDNNR